MSEAKLLEGKILAAGMQEHLKKEIENLSAKRNEKIKLKGFYAGSDDASQWYMGQQEKLAQKLGIAYEKVALPEDPDLLEQKIFEQNKMSDLHGFFLAMPLPKGYDSDKALFGFDWHKDVEGIHPTSLGLIVLRKSQLIPPTAFASFLLIEHAIKDAGKNLRGLKAAIVGQSAIVGRPLQLMLGERGVTTIVCNSGTTKQDLEKLVSEADIVVGCAGQPGLIKGAWIKAGAIVIDVGTTPVDGKLVGDVEFEEAKKRASYITPVPGGVGPLTVTMLMANLVHAYKLQKGILSS